jgi:CubicO group peptidase (beta-lactamase class C family)
MPKKHRFLRHRATPCALAGVIVLSACGGGGAVSPAPSASPGSTSAPPASSSPGTAVTTKGMSFPGATWERTDPVSAGMDPAKLDEIAKKAEDGGSTCLAVFRDGKLVEDWYWGGTTPQTPLEAFSTTKSFASTLVGMAQADGKLSIDDKASKYIPEWAGTPSDAVTVKNLLSNDSGRHWDLVSDYVTMTNEPNKTAYGIGLGQDSPPGTYWAYNNAAIQTLSTVVKKATGEEASAYAKRKLFEPIGMASSEMTHDAAGNTLMYWGLKSTCLDMARFGHLFLNKGNWDGRQIVPAAFVDEATGQASQDINGAYGYLFWVNRPGRMAGATHPAAAGDVDRPIKQWVPGAPEDMYWAAGVGGQTIQVDPGTNTVVTRIGSVNVPAGAKAFDRIQTAEVVTRAITK